MSKKEYKNGNLTIVWEASKCIHAAVCVHQLPKVYDPKARPWIKADNATVEELKAQIDQCPSGALSYYMQNEKAAPSTQDSKVQVFANGPLRVHGCIEVTKADGSIDIKEKGASFCRCGASANKPYCDGAHKNIGFEG